MLNLKEELSICNLNLANLCKNEEGGESNPVGDSSEDDARRPRRHRRPKERRYHDFKVDISEFKGQLDPDIFLCWLQIVERALRSKTFRKIRR